MSSIDIHVDELMDQVREGRPLTPVERRRLEDHCRSCAACQMEWAWLRDGLASGGGVTPEDRQRASAALSALLGTGRLAPAPLGESPPRPDAGVRGGFWRRPRALAWWIALAASLVFGGSAAAALWGGVARLAAQLGIATMNDATPVQLGGPAAPTRPPTPRTVSTPEPAAEAAPEPADEAAPQQSSPAGELRPDAAPTNPAITHSRPPQLDAERVASRLLAAASEARAAEDLSLADERYKRLIARYPWTRSARAGRIARGQLLLDQRQRPAQALREFQEYLRATPSGELAEEARAGVATACERLGLATAEAAAWRDLLRHHPATPHRNHAQHRIAQLAP